MGRTQSSFSLERHYSHGQIARALGGRQSRWVMDAIRAGEFGERWIKLGRNYLVPASDVAAFFSRHRVNVVVRLEEGQAA